MRWAALIQRIYEIDPLKCPKCGAVDSFYLRDDDKEEVIRKRLEVFKNETKPVLNHYDQQGKVIEVVASGSIEEVTGKLFAALKAVHAKLAIVFLFIVK